MFLFTPGEIDYLFQNGMASHHHPEAWEGYEDHIRLDPDGELRVVIAHILNFEMFEVNYNSIT